MSIPDYNRTNWENSVTDADENTMNNIEDGVEGNRGYIADHENRITTNENKITSLNFNVEEGEEFVEQTTFGVSLNIEFSESYDHAIVSLGYDTEPGVLSTLYRSSWIMEEGKIVGFVARVEKTNDGELNLYWDALGVQT